MGTCRLLERQGGFYLAFFVFNCLPMCCYMVMKKNGEAMFSFACFMLLINLVICFLIDKLPLLARRILKILLLAAFFVPFVIEGVVVYNYTALIGVGVVASLLETNMKEAGEFVTMYMGAQEWILVALLASGGAWLFLNKPWRKLHFDQTGKRVLTSCLLVVTITYTVILFSLHIEVLWDTMFPMQRLVLSSSTAIDNIRAYRELSSHLDADVELTRNDSKIKNVVFILGESTNRNHMHLYGYYLPNTPNLDDMAARGEISVFRDVVSPHSTTIAVLSKLFTFCNHESDKPWYEYSNLIDIMNSAGYKTYWLSNQESSGIWGNVAQIYAAHSNVSHFTRIRDSREDDGLEDGALFPLVDEAIAQRAEDKNFYVVHLMGGHGLYYNRFPYIFTKFTKDDIQLEVNEAQKTVIAQYDDALYYNDYIVSGIIDKFRCTGEDSIVVYVPDHGEAVYDEGGFTGHIEENPSRHMIEIPVIIWASDKFKELHPEKWAAIQAAVNNPYMTDDMIHTMLDIVDVQTAGYDPARSIINRQFDVSRPRFFDDKNYDTEIKNGVVQ
ncbi:lipid A phosphoethanolamine transferase [Veillonellaceae bacterium WCA-693-APC-5D-A]|uniref:Lipid A phosphoethanolamine transferase n=2 Tax=Anaerovibrio slackiae TaxID=2652309 RepID=A0A6I2UFX7_9FIRM|nr:lipid A phosphoethanolamine transferase [Anaerovibrio slackiae]